MWCCTSWKLGANRAEPRIDKTKWAQSPLRLGSSVGVSGLVPTEHNGLFGKMASVTTLALRLVLPPLPRPSGFTKLPLCLAPPRRAAQGTGLRAKARLAPKPCLAAKLSVAARCAAAGVAVSALARKLPRVCPRPPQSLALAAPRPRRCSPSTPQGGSLYTALNGAKHRSRRERC